MQKEKIKRKVESLKRSIVTLGVGLIILTMLGNTEWGMEVDVAATEYLQGGYQQNLYVATSEPGEEPESEEPQEVSGGKNSGVVETEVTTEKETAGEKETTTEKEEEKEEPIGKIVIKTAQLNVRDNPNGTIIGKVCMDEEVPYYEVKGGWLRIKVEGKDGYIAGRYGDKYDPEGNLIEAANIPEPEPAPVPEPAPIPEQPVVQPQPEQPVVQPQPEQPVVQPQPEQPVVQPQPEQPVVQPQPAVPAQPDLNSMTDQELCLWVLAQVTTSEMSDMDKVIAVNNYLCAHMEYDLEYYTTRHAIILGRGRCQGYANAFRNIMNTAGIPTDYVRGYGGTTAGGATHAWNRVLIDGQYYCVDVTWNDSIGANSWLLIPEAEFNQSRIVIAYNPARTE